MIDTVTLDFWGTLLTDTPENTERAKTVRLERVGMLLARSGHRVTFQALTRAYDLSGQEMGRRWREHRDWTIREQLHSFLQALAPDLPRELGGEILHEIEEAYITPALSYPPELSPGAAAAVGALHEAGLTLCVISNSGRTPGVILRKLLERHGLLSLFTVVTFSDELSYRKPHPEIFLETLKKAGRDAARAVHVGDDAEADVGGAKGVGMRAIHYCPNGDATAAPTPPDATLSRFDDLPALIRGLLA